MVLMLIEVESWISFSTISNNKELQYNYSMENKEHTPCNYAYLTGALTSKLKWIAHELDSAGLLKAGKLPKAEGIILKAIADAEAAERKYSQG